MENLRLGDIVSISKGRKHSSIFSVPNGKTKRYIQIEDLRNDVNLKYTDEKGVEVNLNDVVIAWDGANAGTIGFNLEGNIGSTLARLRIENKNVDSKFLGCLLRGKFKFLRSQCTGATIPHISKQVLESITVPKIPISEQKKVAGILEQADAAREKRRQANVFTEQFLHSAFIEMFGDPVKNEKKFDIKSLDVVCDKISDGTHFSPPNTENGKYKYITAKNIKKHGFDLSNLTYIDEQHHKEIYRRCNPEFGDVLYIKDGATTGIAMVNTLNEEFSLLSSVALFKLNSKINSCCFFLHRMENLKLSCQQAG